MPLSIIILILVLSGIVFRKFISHSLSLWMVMLTGAIAVLVTGQISPFQAIKAVNLDVIFYLFGVFVLAQASETCGYLEQLTAKLFSLAKGNWNYVIKPQEM